MEALGRVGFKLFVHSLDHAVSARMLNQRSAMFNALILAGLIESMPLAILGLLVFRQQVVAKFGTVVSQ